MPKLSDVLPEWAVLEDPFQIKDENIQASIKVASQYLIHSFRLPVPASDGRSVSNHSLSWKTVVNPCCRAFVHVISDNRQAYPDVDSIFGQYQEEALKGDFLKRYPLKRVSCSFSVIRPANKFSFNAIFARVLVSDRQLDTTHNIYLDTPVGAHAGPLYPNYFSHNGTRIPIAPNPALN